MDRIIPAGIISQRNLPLILGIIALSFVFFALFNFIALLLLVNLPSDFLLKTQEDLEARRSSSPLRRFLGILLLLLGGILSLPGVVGPGFLFIILGLIFLGVLRPEKFRRFLVSRPALLARIDRFRARFGKPPLIRPPNS